MPWTAADVDKHKKGLTEPQKQKWVKVANAVRKQCIDSGGSEQACDAKAIKTANKEISDMNNNIELLACNNTLYDIREEQHNGKIHVVVPLVMMVEGVHAGSQGALFHSADELGKYTAAWNGIPVVVNHPQHEGNFISANDPNTLESESVGRVFNTHMQDKKLKAEAWIEKDKLQGKSPSTLQSILAKQAMDVSVGVFNDEEDEPGTWNGEQYEAVARNHRPDHLALLPEYEGACSWQDGCGIRANQKSVKYEHMSELQVNSENRTAIIHELQKQGFPVRQITANEGYKERTSRVRSKLDAMDTDVTRYYLVELYDDRVIYEVSRENAANTLYSREYQVNEDGTIEFVNDPVQVIEQRTYVELNNNAKMSTKNGQCCPDKVEQLIANSSFTNEDKDWLMEQGETVVDKMLSANQSNKQDTIESLKGAYEKPEDVLNFLNPNARKQVEQGLNLHKAKRDEMITKITTNSSQFGEDELKGMSDQMLEKISGMVDANSANTDAGIDTNGGGQQTGNYVGQGVGNQPQTYQDDEILLPPEVVE